MAMKNKQRYLSEQVLTDLEKKMVFLGGPRQVGKTTFSNLLYPKKDVDYLNWDIDLHRQNILKKEFKNVSTLIFDEIHKYRKWRNYLKGLYDLSKVSNHDKYRILVTGSARLDYYRFGGDSLQGRYNYLRLMPLSFNEIKAHSTADLIELMKLSGFPEPFFNSNEKEAQRWTKQYASRLLYEDIRDLETVTDLGSIELLAQNLNQYVGSPLSINNLKESLSVAHETVTKWIQILERLYLVFRITPFTGNLIKSSKKEQKIYFYNWIYIKDEGIRFENLIAVHLLKYCYWLEDTEGRNVTLHFTKQKNEGEIDFVICEDNNPFLFIEVKLSDQEVNPRLKFFKKKYPKAQFFQISLNGKKDYKTAEGVVVTPAANFFKIYPMV